MRSLKIALYLDQDLILAHVAMGTISRQCGKLRQSGKHFENAISLLLSKQPEDILPDSDGMSVGRMIEIVRAIQELENKGNEELRGLGSEGFRD